MENVAIFGTGYVGLVSGACLGKVGNKITCVDIDEDKVKRLKKGECPIYEPGLQEVQLEAMKSGNLVFTTDAAKAVKHNDIIMLAVGTPPGNDGSADLVHVRTVATLIGKYANADKVVVTKSTVPPLTGDMVEKLIADELKKRKVKHQISVVSNPEFLKEGSAVDDFLKPDRIVVGTNDEAAQVRMRSLYRPFMRQGYKVIFLDRVSTEMTKYAANAMLATKITFMNEMSRIAEKVGADIESIRYGIGADPRIGKEFLYAGPGYGGSCFPKDVKAIAHLAHTVGVTPTLLDAVEDVNKEQRYFFFNKITGHYEGALSGKTFAVWGLAFKANTDDVRESPAETIIEELIAAGANVIAYDPEAHDTFAAHTKIGKDDHLEYANGQYEALENADALIIMTEWSQFRAPDTAMIKKALKKPVIFDARNLLESEEMAAAGFTYLSVGRGTVSPT